MEQNKTVFALKEEAIKKYNTSVNTFDMFKIKTRVKVITPCCDFSFFYGETGEVIENKNRYLGITVKFDKPRKFQNGTVQKDFNFNPEDLFILDEKIEDDDISKNNETEMIDSEIRSFMTEGEVLVEEVSKTFSAHGMILKWIKRAVLLINHLASEVGMLKMGFKPESLEAELLAGKDNVNQLKQQIESLQGGKYYHDPHCNVHRNTPMGSPGCSCFMYYRAQDAEQLAVTRGASLLQITELSPEDPTTGFKKAIEIARIIFEDEE